MARQGYRTNPAQKHLEIYSLFAGGLNTVADRSVLAPHEFSDLSNMDIGDKGTIARRKGFKEHLASPATGKAQGYFRLYLDDGVIHELTAVGGRLYGDGSEIVIEGLEDGFQTERQIEAVQYRKELYIATGTNLVVYDGEEAKVVEPYAPDPLEALYVGANGLADDPSNFMRDGTAQYLRLDGVTFSDRYGVINQTVTLTGYTSKPSGTVEYRFEVKNEIDMIGEWDILRDWSTTRTADFTPDDAGSFQFRIRARMQGSSDDPAEYLIPRFTVKPAKDEEDEHVPDDNIYECNRILLYWDRLILYGDPTEIDAIYISHLNNPAYFPVTNSLRFENVQQEGITNLFRYRDMLVAFTPSSIQALQGKSPLDFQRTVLQSNIGCIAPNAVASIDNYIAFLSKDGVYVLKSLGYTENRANVEKIDSPIANIIPRDEDVSFTALDGQLHVIIPQENKRLRYYYNQGQVWTKDDSPIFNLSNIYEYDGQIIGLSQDGQVVTPDDSYSDVGYVYDDVFETMDFNFGQPNHIKKLKELQISLIGTGEVYLDIYANDSVAFSSTRDHAVVDPFSRTVKWERTVTEFGNWVIGQSSLGVPDRLGKVKVSGRCHRTRVRMTHKGEEPNELLGLAYVFKMKKP